MKHVFKLISSLSVLLFLLAVSASSYATEYWVDGTSGSDTTGDGSDVTPWETIQHAVDNVLDGDIIRVLDGTYSENVNVTKSVTIRSQDLILNGQNDSAIVSGESNDYVFDITAHSVVIEGFTIYGATGTGMAGIYISGETNCTISNNTCGLDATNRNYYGIYLGYLSSGNNISNNTCNFNTWEGIRLYESTSNTFMYNTCNSNTWYGMDIDSDSDDNIISGNTFTSNIAAGIKIDNGSDSNTLTYNTFESNNKGLLLDDTSTDNNKIYLNNFNSNSTNVDSGSGCSNDWSSKAEYNYYYNGKWRTGHLGNYYSDHTLTDSDGDGITDSTYDLPNDEPNDSYPLAATPDNITYLENGLVAHYPFTGNANDASQFYSNDGTVTGATLTEDIFGNVNSAYLFDGSGDYIDCATDASLNIAGAISIAAWIKTVSSASNDTIISKRKEEKEGYQFNISPSRQLGLVLNQALKAITPFSQYDDKWTFVVGTSDGTNVKLFINGYEKKSNPSGIPLITSRANMYIGRFSSFSDFNGAMDEVRIYNRALTQTEITKLYNDSRIKFNPGIIMMLLN